MSDASDENTDFAIQSRMISGCRQQMVDAMLFLPFLIVAIAIGVGLLTLKFWAANWNPSLVSGCFAIIVFACTPSFAFFYWQRWRLRQSTADSTLRITASGLEINFRRQEEYRKVIDWHWIESSKCRKLTPQIRSLRMVVHDPDQPARRSTLEFALCADAKMSDRFAERVAALVSRSRAR